MNNWMQILVFKKANSMVYILPLGTEKQTVSGQYNLHSCQPPFKKIIWNVIWYSNITQLTLSWSILHAKSTLNLKCTGNTDTNVYFCCTDFEVIIINKSHIDLYYIKVTICISTGRMGMHGDSLKDGRSS